MPYRKPVVKKRKGTKKAKAKMPTPVSKMTLKELMRKTPESFIDITRQNKIYTPLRFSFGVSLTGDTTNAYITQLVYAGNAFDPSGSVGARSPYLYDQLMALYTFCSVVRYRIAIDYIDLSTVDNVPYFVFIAVDPANTGGAEFIASPEDLLEHRDHIIRPAYSLLQSGQTTTAGGRRRLKLEFDIARALGSKPKSFLDNVDDLNFAYGKSTATNGTNLAGVRFGLLSQDGTALPATVTGRFTVKIRMLCRLIQPKDLGSS